jgi:hypothetical protein
MTAECFAVSQYLKECPRLAMLFSPQIVRCKARLGSPATVVKWLDALARGFRCCGKPGKNLSLVPKE